MHAQQGRVRVPNVKVQVRPVGSAKAGKAPIAGNVRHHGIHGVSRDLHARNLLLGTFSFLVALSISSSC